MKQTKVPVLADKIGTDEDATRCDVEDCSVQPSVMLGDNVQLELCASHAAMLVVQALEQPAVQVALTKQGTTVLVLDEDQTTYPLAMIKVATRPPGPAETFRQGLMKTLKERLDAMYDARQPGP